VPEEAAADAVLVVFVVVVILVLLLLFGVLNMTPKRRRRTPIHLPHQNVVAETNVYLHAMEIYIGLGNDVFFAPPDSSERVVNAPGAVHATQLVHKARYTVCHHTVTSIRVRPSLCISGVAMEFPSTTEWYSEIPSRRASESEEEESWWRRRAVHARGGDILRFREGKPCPDMSGNGRYPACDGPHGGGPARVTCAFLWVR